MTVRWLPGAEDGVAPVRNRIGYGGRDAMLVPAEAYVGTSMLDGGPAIIIDYQHDTVFKRYDGSGLVLCFVTFLQCYT